LYEFPKNPRGEDSKGLDDHSIYCYFKVRLQPGTLKQDFTDR